MTTLLQIALVNAVTVLPLALLAGIVGRLAHRPALTHALWVLVLLKFVTPPLFNLPVTIEVPVAAESQNYGADVGPVANVPVPAFERRENFVVKKIDPSPRMETSQVDLPIVVTTKALVGGRDSSSVVMRALQTCSTYWAKRPGLQSLLLGCWLAGAALWAILQIVRAVRFQRRVMRDAIAPVELQEQTQRLAKRLGLRRAPQVLIVNATVSPMLWGCGSRARLLFPSDLADRLDDNARATLLTHELAHFGRGDHWVRVLELIVGGLFWWHPVVWWARCQIEEAEEECCDAWVIGEFPDAPRQYAEALLDTIDFLCESRQALPPIASGLGQAHFLRHRLTKIMCGAAPKSLSHRSRCLLALVAALVLPLQPLALGSSSIANLRLPSFEALAVGSSASSVTSAKSTDDSSATSATNQTETNSAAKSSPSSPVAGAPSSRLRVPGEKVWSTAASPDGRFVVRATTARRIVLTDLTTNSESDLSDQQITAVAFAPDGEWFAAAGQDGRVTIWDSARGELLRIVLSHSDVLRSVAVSPQGNVIAAGGRDGAVLVIDLVTGQPLTDFPTYASAVNCVRFSPDGRQLAVAVGDWMSNSRGEVVLLNAATGQTMATLNCATSPGALTFASNDELIVGLWNGHTQLWNLVNRQVVGSAMTDKNVVSAAAFSPDNPALRESLFIAEEPNLSEEPSPLAVLRGLFANPTGSVK